MDDKSVQTLLVSSLSAVRKTYENVIERSRADVKRGEVSPMLHFDHDIESPSRRFFVLVVSYVQCMKRLGVQTWAEVKQLWSKHYGEPEVKEAVDNLLEAEKKYAEFVAEVESIISPLEDKLTKKAPKVGEMLQKDLSLIEIPSGQPKPLEESWKGAKFTLFVFLRLLG